MNLGSSSGRRHNDIKGLRHADTVIESRGRSGWDGDNSPDEADAGQHSIFGISRGSSEVYVSVSPGFGLPPLIVIITLPFVTGVFSTSSPSSPATEFAVMSG